MAKGDKSQYDSLKRTGYIEFWDLREQYEEELERKIQNAKLKNNGR